LPFAHEKLHVYEKGLECFGRMQPLISSWSKQHAFVDHLSRAMESVLFNLVEGTRLRQGTKKLLSLDYALGSAFECAACLDIAVLKQLLDNAIGIERKILLLEICKMLIGLRNSWEPQKVAEVGCEYSAPHSGHGEASVFHHETLDMYTVMLSFYRWFVSTKAGRNLSSGFDRSVDTLATRVVLNIAEGNGRYKQLSRQVFLDTANTAVVKLAVCLDMGVLRGIWSRNDVAHGKQLLLRVGQMTARKDYVD